MKVSIFGLGYVGCVSAACLAKEGHDVVGVDVNPVKVDLINKGQSPIVEKNLGEILHQAVNAGTGSAGSLKATTDARRAVESTDISLVCVGTPSAENGSLKLDYVKRCAEDIGKSLKTKDSYHVVVARSTMLPGSVESVIVPEIEYSSGKKVGADFGAVMNPEFLRESTSVQDFYDPPVTIIGEYDTRSGDAVTSLYHFLDAPLVRTSIGTAEMIKYTCNSFHALKVAFANEIGAICKSIGIDSHKVMDIFCMDEKLNLSAYYLKPGFAFGGSCLPKDLRAINYKAREQDIDTPLLRSILESNKVHIERAISKILQTGKKKIGILGLSFKAGTDDLRESPIVTLTETLIGKGYDLKIYDKNIALAKLVGANKEYIEREIPHISSLMHDDLDDVVSQSEIIVIGNKAEEFSSALSSCSDEKTIFDLVRIANDVMTIRTGYEGVCW